MSTENIENEDPRDPLKREVEELMIHYGDELTILAYSYVKNIEDAKDIVQNVFVTAYLQMGKFRGESTIKTWLYRVTINKCKDYLKSALFKRIILFGTNIEPKQTGNSAEEHLMDKEFARSVLQEVMKLKVNYREVILMTYFQDLKIKEVAIILNLPEATVRSRLQRAKKQLTPLLEQGVLPYV
ncbi:sigma-70 family RNA polymerase sigma factor [Neobacillus notoginsengisoli]|uniref:Sigma-70 family RNA polymerase sigma factor n=1 Tax=Neobacillus notoginsengisoli TaxID=1578198 RepID=A0A417YH49_9BACI|nr:sigma-70 family RNA polymerase sigma factor [Neobacillus notoginsengisoli]RHW32136.1 sigma-70 family RNA polymerase sigma factor [Neobacillus notoginsengisoli]